MADPRFFQKSEPLSLSAICEIAGVSCEATDLMIEDVAPLGAATSKELSFFDNKKYKEQLTQTKAGAVFVREGDLALVPKGTLALVTRSPYKAYALTAQAFYKSEFENKPTEVSPSAIIAKTASIGDKASIAANVVIEDDVEIGENVFIGANTVIGKGVVLGDNVVIGENVTLSHCMIDDKTRIYPGCRIGQDGFGFSMDASGFAKVPQLGRVLIGKNCEIGANTAIDRGAGPDTIIGDGCWLDNLVQIGHNVQMGQNCVIVSQTGIAGSTKLGNFVVIGGQVGIAGHLNIGDGVQIGAKSGVMTDIPAGQVHMGAPSMPKMDFMKQVAMLRKIVNKKND